MPIVFQCICGRQLRAKDESAGRTLVCPACKAGITVPDLVPAPVTTSLLIDMGDPSVDAKLSQMSDQMTVLRRSVRRWRFAGIASALVSLLLSAFAAMAEIGDLSRTSINRPLVRAKAVLSEVVTADSFVILDEKGNPRGGFGCGVGHIPSITLMDEAGTKRVSILLQPDGSPFVVLSGPNGKGKVMLAANESGDSGLVLSDPLGARRSMLGLGLKGTPYLNFLDDNDEAQPVLDMGGKPLFLK